MRDPIASALWINDYQKDMTQFSEKVIRVSQMLTDAHYEDISVRLDSIYFSQSGQKD